MEPDLVTYRCTNYWTINSRNLGNGARTLRWDKYLPVGVGTKHQRSYHLQSAKQFMTMILAARERRTGDMSPEGVLHYFRQLRLLSRWMIHRNLWRFSQLRPSDVRGFLESTVNRGRSNSTSASATIKRYLQMLGHLWLFRESYTASIRFDPLRDRSLARIVKRGKGAKIWNPVPEEQAIAFIGEALAVVERSSLFLRPIMGLVATHSESLRGVTENARNKRTKFFYSTLQDRPEFVQLAKWVGGEGRYTSYVLRRAVRELTGATITLLLFLVGMRLGEVLRLETDCLRSRRHADGCEYLYVSGKGEKCKGAVREWIVPAPVADAIRLVQEMYQALGARRRRRLFISFSGGTPYPSWSARVSGMANSAAGSHFVSFCRSPLRENPIPREQRIHSHQGRKTFALFVVRRDKSGLEALAQHYGHLQTGITDRYYAGSDIGLHALLDAADREDLATALADLIGSQRVGGKAGKNLNSFDNNGANQQRFRGKPSLSSKVNELIDQGVVLAPCNWGYCVYVRQLSACGGGEQGPNTVRRSPDICAGCANFAVTAKHRPWWEMRYRNDEAFLRDSGCSEQSQQLVQGRLNRTRAILEMLNSREYDHGTKK